jgi:hypothetical protein
MKLICSNCIVEDYIRKYIRENGKVDYCSYCKVKKKVIEFEKVVEIIEDGFSYIYDDPANGLGFIDGKYIEGTSELRDTFDLLIEYFDSEEKIFEDLVCCLPDHQWCKKDFYALDDSEENIATWNSFKNLTKYKFRYFFNIMNYFSNYGYSKYKNPNDILEEILEISNRLKLFSKVKKGTIIYRARSGKHTSSNELCSPAPHESIYSNRFSPAGISMFYGAVDEDTCLDEIGEKNDCSIGKWEVLQDILIYDLTYKFEFKNSKYFYNEFPSIFDDRHRKYYHDYEFILDFASDISEKVIKNKNENIDYIPTQIVTEYLKLNKKDLKGISYYSTISGQKNYCLFLDKQQCMSETIIKMVDSEYIL